MIWRTVLLDGKIKERGDFYPKKVIQKKLSKNKSQKF